MNFETAIKTINSDYSYALFAQYMKAEWGISVGYNTVPLHIVRMRKRLADWQEGYDCDNLLCIASRTQPVTVIEFGKQYATGKCVLNPPLFACRSSCYREWPMNFSEIIVNTFTR